MNELIRINDLSKQYNTEAASGVSAINLRITEGQIVAIVGESGSGKSTLLKLIYGLLTPDEGSVLFRGERIIGPEEKLIPGHDRMKMVTQDFDLNTFAKVYDNIASMLSNTNLQLKRDNTQRMMELLRIDHLAAKRVFDLSGGERQRVAIGRALITEPEVLLLDEPFSQLDTILKDHLRNDLRMISRRLGTTIILVSHDPADGLALADEVVIMKGGKLADKGSPSRVYHQPASAYTAKLIADSNVLSEEEAAAIGVKEPGGTVLIYPEWVVLSESNDAITFEISAIFFKGFYDELLVQKNGVTLKMRVVGPHSFKTGDNVTIAITKTLLLYQGV